MDLLSDSRIDELKNRWHGEATLRFLKLSADKQNLTVIGTASTSFILGREFDTQTGQLVGVLTVDLASENGITKDVLTKQAVFVDLVNDTNDFDRWRFQSKTPPQQYRDRFVCYLSAAFNDKTAIV